MRYRTQVEAAILFFAVTVGALAAFWAFPGVRLEPAENGRLPAGRVFRYGFDFTTQGPYSGAGADAEAVASARRVLSSIPGMLEDTPIMDWGLPDPEPSPGKFDLSAIASRIRLITSTGGTPVITLCAAPGWMTGGTGPLAAPAPAHYRDFATLAAKIARSFPQVKYFLVWNELKGFWIKAANGWNIHGYTAMYNDVYRAVRRARPDALVGGAYAPMPSYPAPRPGHLRSTPHGAWGYLDERTLDAVRYWLANMAGADFVAVDGSDFPLGTGPVTDPLTATQEFAAADHWLRHRTSLPIWWAESRVQPAGSGWSQARAAAIRVAALIRLADSGATVAMQWQPEQGHAVPDEGLWTATDQASGGRPTPLARMLPAVLAVLRHPLSVITSPHAGVLVAWGRGGAVAVNTTQASVATLIEGDRVRLRPGQVRVTQ